MIVVDAAAVLEVLLETETGHRVARRIFAPAQKLHVPHLLDLEVAQALRWLVMRGRVSASEAAAALEFYADINLERHAHADLLRRIWFLRENATAYDAAYLALAEALDCPLITCDAKLRTITGHRAQVEVM